MRHLPTIRQFDHIWPTLVPTQMSLLGWFKNATQVRAFKNGCLRFLKVLPLQISFAKHPFCQTRVSHATAATPPIITGFHAFFSVLFFLAKTYSDVRVGVRKENWAMLDNWVWPRLTPCHSYNWIGKPSA